MIDMRVSCSRYCALVIHAKAAALEVQYIVVMFASTNDDVW